MSSWLREALGELLASAALVTVVFASGGLRMQAGSGTLLGTLLGSVALGLGYGTVLVSFGRLSGAQANPLVSLVASAVGQQPWGRTLARIAAQIVGALVSLVGVLAFVRDALRHEPVGFAANPVADGVAAFGFLLIALGVAHRRDAVVPLAVGAFATASFWMTGRATVGNPLLGLTVGVAVGGSHVAWLDLCQTVGADAVGSAAATVIGLYLFPRAREAAASLLYIPRPTPPA